MPPESTTPTDWQALHGNAFGGTRALVTGGAGFIGSHIVQALRQLNAEVVAFDDLSGGDWANLNGFSDGVECVTESILNTSAINDAARDCDFIFHQAALGSVPRSINEPIRYHEVNVIGTVNVLEAARNAGVRRVVYAGSSSAYGDRAADTAKVETMAPRPLSPYAVTKLTGEYNMKIWSRCYGVDTAVTRYFNIFGPRQNANSAYAAVIAAFAKALLTDTTPVIHCDGTQTRDFTYVDNAVHANLLAARCDQPLEGEVCNIACGSRISVNHLFASLSNALGCRDAQPDHQPRRPGDVMHSLADIDKATQLLGYAPLVHFDRGLARTAQWYANNLAS